MNDVLRMKTPMASPDSIRALLQLSKQRYNLYTKRNVGYTDIDGLQYVGTIENFGSEMLLESRKLRMNRPPANVIQPDNTMSYYFYIAYSDFIYAYNQQNMLMGCVRSNTLLSNHTYQLKFTNCVTRNVLRSEAYSDQTVHGSEFYMTNDNPILIVDDEPIQLNIGLNNPTWYFPINTTTTGLYTVDETDVILNDLNDFVDIPAFMLCVPEMFMLPPIRWYKYEDPAESGNLSRDYDPLLEYGTNGNDTVKLYPLIYGYGDVPYDEPEDVDCKWFILAEGDFTIADNDSEYIPSQRELNFTAKITKISYALYPASTDIPYIGQWLLKYDFICDQEYVKVTLDHTDPSPIEHEPIGWIFRVPKSGDYDYDGTTYNNQIYAYIPLESFSQNVKTLENLNPDYIAAFRLSFKDEYYHKYEAEINAMNVGVHIDFTSDVSDHSVAKKFGVIHDLNQFDGLPEYYSYYLDRTIHHAHVEMFAIREDANMRNQHAMDRQTAAIILDSGIPINEYESITDDMEPVITYDTDYQYTSDESKVISFANCLSNIGFVDGNHFADVEIKSYSKQPKFVYHGNYRFSLGIVTDDESTTYGRVYLLSNDPASYENNNSSRNPKAPRTVARICDIPYTYGNLESIENVSPPIVIDEKYIHQEASFSDDLYLRLWNDFCSHRFCDPSHDIDFIFPSYDDIITYATSEKIIEQNGDVEIPRRTVNLRYDRCTARISYGSTWTSYMEGDRFGFNIGGLFFKGIVTSTFDGMITNFTIEMNSSIPGQPELIYSNASDEYSTQLPPIDVPIENFDGQITSFKLTNISGHGDGASIEIDIGQEIWNERITGIRSSLPSDLYAFYRLPDERGIAVVGNTLGQWIESTATQLTGDLSKGNPSYDDPFTKMGRTLTATYLRNMLTNRNIEEDYILEYISGKKDINLESITKDYDPPSFSIEKLADGDDLSTLISSFGMNTWNAFIMGLPIANNTDQCRIASWMYDMNASYNYNAFGNGNLWFPAFSGMCFDTYDNSWSCVKFTVDDKQQIIPFMYDIMHTTYDTYDIRDCIRLTKQETITLRSMLPNNLPYDTRDPYSGNTLNYNLYRLDHFKTQRIIQEYEATLSDLSFNDLLNLIHSKFGENTPIDRYYTYQTKDYESNTIYQESDLIVYHVLETVPYVTNRAYAVNTIIVDMDTRNMYRATQPFVSTSLEYDIEHGLIVFIGVKPVEHEDVLYRATKRFESTTIDADVSAHNLEYIGPDNRFNMMVQYIIQNTYGDTSSTDLIVSDDLSLYEPKDSQMTIKDDEPIGGFVPVIDVVDTRVTVNGRKEAAEPLYVFRIDDEITDLRGLKMYNGDVDISDQSLLLIKHGSSYRRYLYHNGIWEWNYHEIS